MQGMEPDEGDPGFAGDDPARLYRLPVIMENRQLDPREDRVKSGAPDDVGNVERAAIGKNRQAIVHADRPADTLDTGGRELLRLHADERSAPGDERRMHLPAKRGVQ